MFGNHPWYQFLNYSYFCILSFHWIFRLPNSFFFTPNLKFPWISTKSLRRRGSYGSYSHWSWRRCTEGGWNWWSSPQRPTPLKNSDWIFYIISIISVQDWLRNRSVCVYLCAFHVFSVLLPIIRGPLSLRQNCSAVRAPQIEPPPLPTWERWTVRLAQLGGRVATNRKRTQVCGRILWYPCNHAITMKIKNNKEMNKCNKSAR